mgnify:CR=1 FL=1
MTLRRLHVADLPLGGGTVVLGEAASRHVRVLRLRAGHRVELFDGDGRGAQARLDSIGDSVVCIAEGARELATRRARLVLVLGLPKGAKLDVCVRMATELGVDEIALLMAERSVPRWDPRRGRAKVERLNRIAAEAATQSERADLPTVHAPRTCDELLRAFPAPAHGVLFVARARGALELPENPQEVWCAVGPEGGFATHELAAFEAAGFRAASLGPTILRVDTAVAAALSLVRDRDDPLQPR